MVEDGRSGGRYDGDDPPDDLNRVERSPGSGLIFALVAIALILAISFFYLTKDREANQGNVITQAEDSSDSAARIVGDAAQNAADTLRDRN